MFVASSIVKPMQCGLHNVTIMYDVTLMYRLAILLRVRLLTPTYQ